MEEWPMIKYSPTFLHFTIPMFQQFAFADLD